MSWLKRRLPKKRWKRIVLYVLSTMLMLVAADMALVQYWRRIEVSPETTGIIAPMTAAGLPDYVTALNAQSSEGVTATNNSAPLLLKVLGTTDMPDNWRKLALPTLGLPPEGTPPRLVGFYDWLRTSPGGEALLSTQGIYDQLSETAGKPWKSMEYPLWAQWLDSQQAALIEARVAIDRPRFFIPLEPAEDVAGSMASAESLNALNELFIKERQLSIALLCSAMRCAGEGDVASFQRDSLAAMKLARLVGQGPSLLHVLVCYGTESISCRAISGVATKQGAISAAQIRSLVAAFDDLPPVPTPDRALDSFQRWLLLDTLSYGAQFGLGRLDIRLGNSSHPSQAEAKSTSREMAMALLLPVHFNRALRDTNDAVDRVVASLRLPGFPQRIAALIEIENEISSFAEPTVAHFFGKTSFVTMSHAFGSPSRVAILEQRSKTERDLARVALGLAAYREGHGAYPEKLETLAGGVLQTIPADGFSGAPLLYRREGTGYVLYSVGADGKDDGGIDPAKAARFMQDIVVRAER